MKFLIILCLICCSLVFSQPLLMKPASNSGFKEVDNAAYRGGGRRGGGCRHGSSTTAAPTTADATDATEI
ncbi:hypothetical protein FF38_06452 [Lucilia cuprina]|uniref:Uncharacterized protein n=1 Tax=Lucilia cuprina TaxID=7375 RepID=A0A0L0CP08_LUCCU|nr:hypothetical protein CVS40_4546 [Lucilia cuprina]KNC34088.1 hypothetical protein FF38_06452 [Lucilia cuprina]